MKLGKFAHTAALALVGWYLMVPPSRGSTPSIARWDQYGSFETIDDCEAFRTLARRPATSAQNPPGPVDDDERTKDAAINQYLETGREPTTFENPSYGPVGALLQALGVRSKTRPVTPELRFRMHVAKRLTHGMCIASDDPRLAR